MDSELVVAPAPVRKAPIALIVGGIIAAVIILLAALGYLFISGRLPGVLSSYGVPEQVRGALFTRTEHGKTRIYTPGPVQFTPLAYTSTDRNTISRSGSSVLAVDHGTDGKYLIMENDLVRGISKDPVTSVTKAPTEHLIVYAVSSGTEKGSEKISVSVAFPSLSKLKIILGNGSTTDLIAGASPLFIDDTHLLFFAASGVYRYDLATGKATLLLKENIGLLFQPVVMSPDHTLVVFRDPYQNATIVYRIGDTSLTQVLKVPDVVFSPALTNTALYDVRGNKLYSEIWKYPLDGSPSSRIHAFPEILALTRIIF